MLIRGKMVKGKDSIAVRYPFSGEITGRVSALNSEDVGRAISYSKHYNFSLSGYERYEIILNTARALNEQKEEYAGLIAREIGISLKDSLHEVGRSVSTLILSAEEAKRIGGEIPPSEVSPGITDHLTLVIREPVGVICCITPFNHPLNQVVHKVGPALAANNAVVLKPSIKCPLTALKFARLLLEQGLPREMIQVITGYDRVVGPSLIQHPDIDMISFTGSTAVGDSIARSCGIKKLFLELGGNDVFLVAPDADVSKAAEIAVAGAFGNSGQRCSSIKRIIAFPENADRFAELLVEKTQSLKVGDPLSPTTDIGTMVNERAASTIMSRINSAVRDGAHLLIGGQQEGAFLWPTVLDHVHPECALVALETFGPVAPIIRSSGFEDAIRIANSTSYGLNAAIMTNQMDLALKFSKRLRVGGIRINQAPSFRNELVPFGGNKMSGFGRSGVRNAVYEMTNLKTIIIA